MDEKDQSVRPLGRARGGDPGLALSFRNAMFPSWCLLSPLFHQGGQIFIFPAPLTPLGVGHISQLICFPAGSNARRRGALLGAARRSFQSQPMSWGSTSARQTRSAWRGQWLGLDRLRRAEPRRAAAAGVALLPLRTVMPRGFRVLG
jgi:hypothetical protein